MSEIILSARAKLLLELYYRGASNTEIMAHTGYANKTSVSKALSRLRRAGLIPSISVRSKDPRFQDATINIMGCYARSQHWLRNNYLRATARLIFVHGESAYANQNVTPGRGK